jgi:hypothetical protein
LKKNILYIFFLLCANSIFAQPVITSFSPTSGPVGTVVTITGTNFNTTAVNNIVFFGAVKATVNTASATSLTVTAPAGTTYQPITVTTGGLTGFSNKPFVITFNGGSYAFTSGSFDQPKVTSFGGDHTSSYLKDLDGDGKADLIVTDLTSHTCLVSKNISSGVNILFENFISLSAGSYPYAVISEDIDGDGKPEIILTDLSDNKISVFRNLSTIGNILFSAKIDFATGNSPSSLCTKDLNDDGKIEVVVSNYDDNTFSVFKNSSTIGVISFEPKIDFPTGIKPQAISIDDIDGDNKADIAAANSNSNTVSIFRNSSASGIISFFPKLDLPTGNKPYSTAFGDIDLDGKPDLIISNWLDNTITIKKNSSTVGNISFVDIVDLQTSDHCYSVNINDLNGDGKIDITGATFYEVEVFKNITTSNIAFNNGVGYENYPSINSNLNIADLEGDGKADLIYTSSNSNNIYTTRNKTNETSVAKIEPNEGGNGTHVYITGANFINTSAVSFGGIPASSFNVLSSDSILAVVGVGATGLVSVTTPLGTDTLTGFTWFAPPTINSFTPTSAADGTTVTITGSNFTGSTQVSFGGTPAASFAIISPTSITAIVQGGASGNIKITNPAGLDSIGGFTYLSPPHIVAFTPTYGGVNDTILISGTNFTTTSNIRFGDSLAQNYQVLSDTTIRAVVGNGVFTGTLPINVYVATNNGIDSLNGFNWYPSIHMNSFTPNSGGTLTEVLISGLNFETINLSNSASVTFGGVPSQQISFYSDTLIGVYPSIGSSGYIKVSNPISSDSLGIFTYINSPFISSFTPSTAFYGDTVLIYGNNLSTVTTVKFGSVIASSFTAISDTLIKAIVGNGASGNVEVYTNYGYSIKSGFTYLSPPIINSINPNSARTGDLVEIYGNYFDNTSSVSFGGVLASSFSIVGPTRIDAIVGNGASGDVIVTTPLGADTLTGFTFLQDPTITSFTPTTATIGDTITIIGTNFNTVTNVSFGNVNASSFTPISATQLKAIVGNGATGNVIVTNNAGSDTLSGFTFIPPPIITSFTPSTGDSGIIVIINGNNFSGTTAVNFGGTPAISFTVISNLVINAVVGNGTTGNINVTTPQGSSSLGTFTVFPYLNSVDLNLCANGNTTITSNFSGATYQWQLDTGSGFANISNNANYTGTNTNTLHLNSIPSAWYGYKYRCFINSSYYSRQTVIKFSNIWTGAVSNIWENPANWSCGIVPDANTDVVIPSGTVIVGSNIVIRSLTLGNGATYTITPPNTVTVLGANPATGNLGGSPTSCTPFIINGTYNQEVALNNTNSVQIQVNVTSTGPYGITTNTIGGINFFKAGMFTTTGLQTIVLEGRGTPGLSGNQNFTVSFGSSICTFTINVIAAPLNFIPTTLNSNWSYAATSTPDPIDSLYKQSLPNFLQFNGQTYREFLELNEFILSHNSGYRKSANNYYFYYNHFDDTHSLALLDATGEIKQLDENALVGGTWISNINGWVNGVSTNAPVRVQGTVLEKGVSVSLPTGLNFSNVIKVRLDFYDMTFPSFPNFVYAEERWFAFGVGLIYYKSTDPFGTGIIYQLKRYQVN